MTKYVIAAISGLAFGIVLCEVYQRQQNKQQSKIIKIDLNERPVQKVAREKKVKPVSLVKPKREAAVIDKDEKVQEIVRELKIEQEETKPLVTTKETPAAEAKLVSWKTRYASVRRSSNAKVKSLWKKALILNKVIRKERNSGKRKELLKRRNDWGKQIDILLGEEDLNHISFDTGTMGPIDIRNRKGNPEFYDTVTGRRFIPRGINYTWNGNSINEKKIGFHNVFDPIGDGSFQERKEIYFAAIKDIAANKYNLIRVFLNADAMGPTGQKGSVDDPAPSINEDYINNIKEFLREAKKHNLRVTITSGHRIPFQYIKTKPAGSTFHNIANTAKIRSTVNKIQFYVQQDLLESQMQYHADLVKALLTDKDKSLRNVLFSYEPIQEYFLPKKNEEGYLYPWHLETFGPWPAENSSTEIKPRIYNLKDNHEEQCALAEDINYYKLEQIVKSIRKIKGAEKLLITFSGMLNVSDHGGDIIENERFWGFGLNYHVFQKLALKDGHMYADVHMYPSPLKVSRSGKRISYPWSLDLALASIGLSKSRRPKLPFDLPEEWKRLEMKIPFVIGEFGARKPEHPKPSFNSDEEPLTPKRAEGLLKDFQIESCAFGFQGWCYWIYHDDGTGMPFQFFNPQDNNEINIALAPKYRPDPGK